MSLPSAVDCGDTIAPHGRCGRTGAMRILVVGTGGVGSAFARHRAPARRSSTTARSPTTTSPARPRVVESLDDGRLQRAPDRRLEHGRRARADPRDAARRGAERRRPGVQRADLRRLPRGGRHVPRHGDDALRASSRAPVRADRASSSATTSSTAPRRWEEKGLLALVGIGIEPGAADVFARHAADELFSEIDEVGIRDGANLVVEGYDFAPTFSIWTTIEECLNPPVVWERDRGWFTTAPFSEPEMFDFPEGIGPGRVRQRRARGGAARPALDRLPAGDVQVRPRRRVHRGAEDARTSSGSTARSRSASRASRSRRATWSPPRSRIRPRSATG